MRRHYLDFDDLFAFIASPDIRKHFNLPVAVARFNSTTYVGAQKRLAVVIQKSLLIDRLTDFRIEVFASHSNRSLSRF